MNKDDQTLWQARIQPCFRKLGINLGYYDGKEIWPRNITERNIALKLHNNHFCLICKPEGVSFNQAVKELKDNFKMVDNYITNDNVKFHFGYIYHQRKLNHIWLILLYTTLKHIIQIAQNLMYFVFIA